VLAAIIASLVVAVALAGCSAGGGASTGEDQAGRSDAEGQENPAEPDRAVIIEGTMSIVVADVAAATEDAADVVRAAGGRIEGRDESSDQDGAMAYAVTTMLLRIPAAGLDTAIDALRVLGAVESLQTSSTDVTTAVEDVDAHVSALESTLTRLQSFQDRAKSVDDLLAIEKEISARQAELEGYLAKRAGYADRVELSTITLTLRAESAPTAAAPDSFWGGLVVGWNSFTAFLGGLAVALGVLLPWLLAIALLTVAVVFIVRWIARRRRVSNPASQVPEPAQAPMPPTPETVDASWRPPSL
jgi:hypothetical protein